MIMDTEGQRKQHLSKQRDILLNIAIQAIMSADETPINGRRLSVKDYIELRADTAKGVLGLATGEPLPIKPGKASAELIESLRDNFGHRRELNSLLGN